METMWPTARRKLSSTGLRFLLRIITILPTACTLVRMDGYIGAPGTPPEQRVSMRGTIWRYHPQRKTFEALTYGCTNPWGHDWNEHGELFFINTVNGQLWHDFAGAHFVRPHTIDPNPRVYDLIDQHADHWHFDTAQGWAKGRDGKADAYGGGHAHIGMMIYQGDNWPADYRGRLYTLN